MKNLILNLILFPVTVLAGGAGGPGGADLIDGELADLWINKKISRVHPEKLKGYKVTVRLLEDLVRARVPGFATALTDCGMKRKWILTDKKLHQGTLESPVELPNRARLARQNKYEIRIDLTVYNSTDEDTAGETWFHELVRCAAKGMDDETIQDLNIELHDDTRTAEELVEIIENHGFGKYKTKAEEAADQAYVEKQTRDFKESLVARKDFLLFEQEIKRICLAEIGSENGEIPIADTQKITKVLNYVASTVDIFLAKGLPDKPRDTPRTRQQIYYINMASYLIDYVSRVMSSLTKYEMVDASAQSEWLSKGRLPRIRPHSEVGLVWQGCGQLGKMSDDWHTNLAIGFYQGGSVYLKENADPMTLKDPELDWYHVKGRMP